MKHCLPPAVGDTWQNLIVDLTANPDSAIAQTLTTPLALWLFRKVYIDTRTDPSDLWNAVQFPTADLIGRHLLDHLVSALITTNPPRYDSRIDHPFRPRRNWNSDNLQRWLGYLAHHLENRGTRDFNWWRLHQAIPALQVKIAVGLTLGLPVAFTTGLAINLTYGRVYALIFGPIMGLASGLAFGFASPSEVGPNYADLRFQGRTRLLLRQLAAELKRWIARGLLAGLLAGLASGLTYQLVGGGLLLGIAGGVAGGLVFGVAFGLSTGPVAGVAFGFAGGLAGGLTGGLVGELLSGLTQYEQTSGSVQLFVSALVIGLFVGIMSGIMTGTANWVTTPVSNDRPSTPASTLRSDFQLSGLRLLMFGIPLGLLCGLLLGLDSGSAAGVAGGIAFGFTGGTAFAFLPAEKNAAGVTYAIAAIFLIFARRLPPQLMCFLDDAYRLGLLRQAGAAYQFRHSDLQDRLAYTYQYSRTMRLMQKPPEEVDSSGVL